jgi:hypothetical protein
MCFFSKFVDLLNLSFNEIISIMVTELFIKHGTAVDLQDWSYIFLKSIHEFMLIVLTYLFFLIIFFFVVFSIVNKKKVTTLQNVICEIQNMQFLSYHTFHYLFELLFEAFILCSDPGADVGLVFKLSVR